jgi:predicted PurR-regulated permease PerM
MTRIAIPRFIAILLAAIGGFWLLEQVFGLLYRLADILLLFGLAWLLKLLLDPLIRRLQRAGTPRGLAITVAYLLAIGGLIGGLLALAPQVAATTQNIPRLVQMVAARAEDAAIWLQQRGVEINPEALTNQIIGIGGQVGTTIAGRVVTAAQSFLNLLGRTALVITVSVYMSLTAGRVSVLRPVVPPRWRDEYDAFVQDVNSAYSSYIRGYFYVVALGTLMSAALLFGFRIPGAFVWLMIVFVLRLLPFIGGTLSDILLVLVIFFELPYTTGLIAISLVIIGQFVLTNILMPRVMGRELGINPLMVLFAVLLGGKIYGVAGILFAIPAAAVIATITGKAINRYLLPTYDRPGWWATEVLVETKVSQREELIERPEVAAARAPAAPRDINPAHMGEPS